MRSTLRSTRTKSSDIRVITRALYCLGSRIALQARLLRRPSQTKEHVRSLLLSTAARDYRRSPRIVLARASRSKPAYFVVLRRPKSTSAHSSSARRRAITDARQGLSWLAHRAPSPPTSSSFADQRARPLTPPQHGGARLPTLAKDCLGSRIALQARLLRRPSQTKEHVRSLLLSTAARDYRRSPRIVLARASRSKPAYFVVARRRKSTPAAPAERAPLADDR